MPANQKLKRPELYADDLDHMHALMAKLGIGGNSATVFHALLEAFEHSHNQQTQHQTQTFSDVAQTLNWFTTEIATLRQQVAALEAERDDLEGTEQDGGQLTQLQAENQQLRAELKQTQSRLAQIQQLLGGATASGAQTASTVEHDPAHAIGQIPAPPLTHIPADATPQNRTLRALSDPDIPTPQHRRRGDTAEVANQIIDALLDWNAAQDDSQRQLRISIPILKELGATYQQAVQEVMRLRQDELEQHHNEYGLKIRHNATVPRRNDLLREITQQYLQQKPQS